MSSIPSAPAIMMYVVGTPNSVVAWCFSTRWSCSSGLGLAVMTTLLRCRIAAGRMVFNPVTWKRTTASMWRSSGRNPKPSSADSALKTTLAWVSMAPFGRPVVPDV